MQPSADPAKITVDDYPRMLTWGWIALVVGLGSALVLLTVGITTRLVLPTGFAALTMGMFLSGCILLVGRLVLRKQDQMRVELEDHRAEHQAVMLDAEDIATIRKQTADTLAIVARWDLERKDERKLVAQVEEFLTWKANADRRLALLEGDNVIDLDTMRAAHEINKHLPKQSD